jgi:hypothetical protein
MTYGQRAFRYHHPYWVPVAAVRECRGGCPCYPGRGHPSHWHAYLDVPDYPPLTHAAQPDSSCYVDKITAQRAVYTLIEAWDDAAWPGPEDAPGPDEPA